MRRRAHTDIINIANNGSTGRFFYTSKVQKMNQRERNALHAGRPAYARLPSKTRGRSRSFL